MTTATTDKQDKKITYTSAAGDMTKFHRSFDEALGDVRGRIGGAAAQSTLPPIVDTSPIDTSWPQVVNILKSHAGD